MSDAQREILERVATGELSPEEAAERLADLDETEAPSPEEPTPRAPTTPYGDVARVKVIGSFRTTRITGDPDVKEVVVDGPHIVRRDGDTITIEDDKEDLVGDGDGPARAFAYATDTTGARFKFRSARRRSVHFGLGAKPEPLEIRMNPSLPLDVELAAGTLHVRGVRAPITADVSAGTARIEGVASPIDVNVAAGSVHIDGLLDRGNSKVRCEAGAVKIDLAKGSSVKITTRVGLGKVVVPDDAVESGGAFFIGAGARKATLGDGTGTLDIEASLGKVEVRAER